MDALTIKTSSVEPVSELVVMSNDPLIAPREVPLSSAATAMDRVFALPGSTTTTTPKTPSYAATRKKSIHCGTTTAGKSKKKKSASLPQETVEYLKAWMMSPEHVSHPYPTELEKAKIMQETGIELKQLTNWFVNNRKRFWKPRVEAQLREQQQGPKKDCCLTPPPLIQRQGGSLLPLMELAKTSALAGIEPNKVQEEKCSNATTLFPSRRDSTASLVSSASPTTRIISEQNSVVSSSESVDSSSSDDEDGAVAHPTVEEIEQESSKTESITVHILRPSNTAVPELSDVTVLSNIPRERVLRSFEHCALTYSFTDAAKATSRRDAEIVRIKKHYLNFYLSELHQGQTNNKKRQSDDDFAHILTAASIVTPQRKYRRVSVDLWKETCQNANHANDLPSLEEAALLFGFASS